MDVVTHLCDDGDSFIVAFGWVGFLVRVDSAERVLVGLLKWGRPNTGRKLAKELGMSPATVNRAIEDLIERGWVVRLDQLPVSSDYLLSLGTHSRYMPVVVNFDRPGIEQYLDYLFVEHGVSADDSRGWMRAALRGAPELRPFDSSKLPGNSDPYERLYPLLEEFAGLEDGFAGIRVRDLELRMTGIFNELVNQENFFQKIYAASHEEQARELIHFLIPLDRELRGFEPKRNGLSPIVSLSLLAVQCHRSAQAVWRAASWVWERARVARLLRDGALGFGERAMAGVLPMNDSLGSLSTHDALRDLATFLQRKYQGGDLSAWHTTGNGGDVLLAAQLREYAIRLHKLAAEIRALPALRGDDDRPKGSASRWPLDLYELDEFFGAPLEGETVGDYEARFASLEVFEFEKVERDLSERVKPSATFYVKPMPDYVKDLWQKLHVSVGEVAQGDVITSVKGQELWHPVLVAHADADRLELTYGVGDQVAFWREWMTPVKDAFTVYRDTGARKRKTLPIKTHPTP